MHALTPGKRQSTRPPLRAIARAALLSALVGLPGCTDLELPREEAPPAAAMGGYNGLIANHVKSAFKDRAAYSAFQISGSRWVHSLKGWNWLVCIRFQDRGHERTYALFIKDNAVVDGRYAVQTDACDAQAYSPFDLATGSMRPANAGLQEPLY